MDKVISDGQVEQLRTLTVNNCGCSPVCECASQQALAIWKENAQDSIRAILSTLPPAPAAGEAVAWRAKYTDGSWGYCEDEPFEVDEYQALYTAPPAPAPEVAGLLSRAYFASSWPDDPGIDKTALIAELAAALRGAGG